jgi:hypothetical protein
LTARHADETGGHDPGAVQQLLVRRVFDGDLQPRASGVSDSSHTSIESGPRVFRRVQHLLCRSPMQKSERWLPA